MFSYQKIVFGIKHAHQISDVLNIFKEQRSYSIMISEHNAEDVDDCCDRPGVHYHGVLEYASAVAKIEEFLMHLYPYCMYIKHNHCSNPTEYLAYITLSPKRIIIQELLNSSKLLEYLHIASGKQLEVMKRKKDKRLSILETNIIVKSLVESFLKYGYKYNHKSRLLENELYYRKLLKTLPVIPESLSNNVVEAALSVSKKIVMNSSILDLSERFDCECEDDYLSPEESANFVLDWCLYQDLNPKEFVKNLIRCLDKRGGNRNSIYLQGSRNSGKSYIVQSIIEACIHVGQVVVESSAYFYVWENCVDKRLIVLKEPHFSTENADQLDKVLSGLGTIIYKHNDVMDYLQPTPVIILANEHDWTDDPKFSETIKKRFLCSYMDLKNFSNMNKRKLHPRWLTILDKTLSNRKNSKADKKTSETICDSLLKPNPDMNNGMNLITQRGLNIDNNASSHSLKTNENCGITTQISNISQASGNTMEQNPKYRKRPMTDTGHDGEKKKMNRVNQENE